MINFHDAFEPWFNKTVVMLVNLEFKEPIEPWVKKTFMMLFNLELAK